MLKTINKNGPLLNFEIASDLSPILQQRLSVEPKTRPVVDLRFWPNTLNQTERYSLARVPG